MYGNEPPDKGGPLRGIKVLELGSLIAGPFAGRLLADFGAEVVKVELPGKGDPLRKWRIMHRDTSLWWYAQSRNKTCVTIDLSVPAGQDIIRRLVEHFDIIIENFKPGTLEKWGIGYEELRKINPRVILVRVSGYGQYGPNKDKAGFGSIGEAVGGLRYLTGDPDRPPTRSGISIGDSVAALYAVIGALMAVYHRDLHGGEGQVIDIALYEAIFSLTESMVGEYDKAGVIRGRSGSSLPGIVPSGTYLCKDGRYIVIAGNGDGIFKRLMQAIGREDMKDDSRFASNELRVRHGGYLDRIIEEWTRRHDLNEALPMLERYDVPASAIFSVADIMQDAHYRARDMICQVDVDGDGAGDGDGADQVKMPGIVPKFSGTPGRIQWAGPGLGAHTEQVLREKLGMSGDELARHRQSGVI